MRARGDLRCWRRQQPNACARIWSETLTRVRAEACVPRPGFVCVPLARAFAASCAEPMALDARQCTLAASAYVAPSDGASALSDGSGRGAGPARWLQDGEGLGRKKRGRWRWRRGCCRPLTAVEIGKRAAEREDGVGGVALVHLRLEMAGAAWWKEKLQPRSPNRESPPSAILSWAAAAWG